MSNLKSVDLCFVCPDTGKKVGLEVCTSTWRTEPGQCGRDLAAQALDAVIVVTPTYRDLERLEKEFRKQLGDDIDSRITLCVPWHLASVDSLKEIHQCSGLVFGK